jgi:thaumarchaeosortase
MFSASLRLFREKSAKTYESVRVAKIHLSSFLKNVLLEHSRPLIIAFSSVLLVSLLYLFNPTMFQEVWKGYLPLLIFLWLVLLEITLNWNKPLQKPRSFPTGFKVVLTAFFGIAPTIYVLAFFLSDLDQLVLNVGRLAGLSGWFLETSWPISLQYLVSATFITLLLLLLYKGEGLRRFSASTFFIWSFGAFYTMDTFYPYGKVTVLQNIVPWIVGVVALTLSPMGYHIQYNSNNCLLTVDKPGSYIFRAHVYWPCAGVYSLFIYTFVTLLFLKGTAISLKGKVIYFIAGAVGTFFVNALRVATICKLAVDQGQDAGRLFHTYYGELFFIAWIIIYPFIILGSRKLWMKLSSVKFLQDSFKDKEFH